MTEWYFFRPVDSSLLVQSIREKCWEILIRELYYLGAFSSLALVYQYFSFKRLRIFIGFSMDRDVVGGLNFIFYSMCVFSSSQPIHFRIDRFTSKHRGGYVKTNLLYIFTIH